MEGGTDTPGMSDVGERAYGEYSIDPPGTVTLGLPFVGDKAVSSGDVTGVVTPGLLVVGESAVLAA